MKNSILLFIISSLPICHTICQAEEIRQDTLHTEDTIYEKRLSPEFQKELWSAFTLTPSPAPIENPYPSDFLTREQLKEWLGVSPTDIQNATPFTLPFDLSIPKYTPGSGCKIAVDVNALAKYIRPKEIMLHKMHKLADSARTQMDRIFPTDGLARPIPADTVALKGK